MLQIQLKKGIVVKVAVPEPDGSLVGSHGFIDYLLREERVCDIFLPRIKKRHGLEENNKLKLKMSASG